MNRAVHQFLQAHDRYLALDDIRVECSQPVEREMIYIELLKAYLEVQYRAKVIAGLQFAEGMDFAEIQ